MVVRGLPLLSSPLSLSKSSSIRSRSPSLKQPEVPVPFPFEKILQLVLGWPMKTVPALWPRRSPKA
jgi:hypothetical protein